MIRKVGVAVVILVLVVAIIQAISGAAATRRAAEWEAKAKAQVAKNDSLMKHTARLTEDSAAHHIAFQAARDSLTDQRKESARLSGVVDRLLAQVPPLPADCSEACRATVAGLRRAIDTLKLKGVVDSLNVRKADSLAAREAFRVDSLFGVVKQVRGALFVSDSLLNHRPKPPGKPRASVLLGTAARVGSDVSLEGSGGLGVALKGGVAYLEAVITQHERRIDVGWRKSLKLF